MKLLNGVASIIVFVVVWYIFSFLIGNQLFPSPVTVFEALVVLFLEGEIFIHIYSSLFRIAIGFSVAFVLAVILAYSFGFLHFFGNITMPIIEILRPIPPIAWIPLSIVWFGLSDFSSAFIIFIAAFFPIFTSLYFGIKSIPRIYHRISKNYKLNVSQKLSHIVVPFSLPYLFNGSKTGIGIAWMALIGAEIISASKGLGYYIEISRLLLKIDEVIAVMIIIGVIGFLLVSVFSLIENQLVYWGGKNE